VCVYIYETRFLRCIINQYLNFVSKLIYLVYFCVPGSVHYSINHLEITNKM
jgi:hypothetical protein